MSEYPRAGGAEGSVQRNDALPSGWKQALERSKNDLADGNIIDFFESQDAAERDFDVSFAASG